MVGGCCKWVDCGWKWVGPDWSRVGVWEGGGWVGRNMQIGKLLAFGMHVVGYKARSSSKYASKLKFQH